METLVVFVSLFIFIWLSLIIAIVTSLLVFFFLLFGLFLCFLSSFSCIFLLLFVEICHSLQVIGLLSRKLHDSAEPLTREDQLIPQSHTLTRVKVVEPKVEFFLLSEALSPHFLQHREHSMVLSVTPGRCFDSIEFERVPSIVWLSNLGCDAVLMDLFFHLLTNWSLNLGDQKSHQVVMSRFDFLIFIIPGIFIMYLLLFFLLRSSSESFLLL